MGLVVWVLLFVVLTALAAWAVFGDALDRASGVVDFDFWTDSDNWSDDGVRLFVGFVWLAAAAWFFYGLAAPATRLGL